MSGGSRNIPELEKLFPSGPERLQKILARAGLGSRRKCEEIISDGRVKVDGKVVRQLGSRANPETQTILVDEKPIAKETYVYYLLNKPKNVLCTADDPQDRRTVLSYFPAETRRIFPVGRLDLDSKGAVILTNDGRLTQILTHPRYGIERTYQVRVRGQVDDYTLNRLRSGIQLSEGRTSPAEVWITRKRGDETELGITIHEGWNRQVRRMFAAVSHKVRSLTRIQIGTVTIKGLASSEARSLTRKEIRELVKLAMTNESEPPSYRKRSTPRPKRQGKPDPRIAWEEHQRRQNQQSKWQQETMAQIEFDEPVEPKPERRSDSRNGDRNRRGQPSRSRSSNRHGDSRRSGPPKRNRSRRGDDYGQDDYRSSGRKPSNSRRGGRNSKGESRDNRNNRGRRNRRG